MADVLTYPFDPAVKEILRFIGSRKRKVYTYRRKAGSPETFHTYWDGGSRSQYVAYRNGHLLHIPVNGHPQFDASGRNPVSFTPQAGDLVVRYGISAGKPVTPSFTYYE